MGAKYETHTIHNLGWGNSNAQFNSPSMYSGDIGITIQWGSDGRQTHPASEWPDNTPMTLVVRTNSNGEAWSTNHVMSIITDPPVGVSAIGWNGSEYQSFNNAIRISGALPQNAVFTGWYFGNGQGGGGYWGKEITSGIVAPYYIALGTYGVADAFNPRVDAGAATGTTRAQQNTDVGRGWCWAYLYNSNDATPLLAFDHGNDTGFFDNAGAVAGFNGILGGARGIIIMQFKRFMDELMRGLIPPREMRRRWDHLMGHTPPVGTPVLEWVTANPQGEIVGRGQSDIVIMLDGYGRIMEDGHVESIQHNRRRRQNRSGLVLQGRKYGRGPSRSPLLAYR